MRRTWEIGAHTFPIVWVLFSIRFIFFSVLYKMRNTWVSPSVSPNMGKCSEIHRIGRIQEIGTHFFPDVWTLFLHRFPSYGILYHMGNAWFFPTISNSTGKCSKINPVSFLVVFPQYYCVYLLQNLLIFKKKKQKKKIR